jgi:hypothetical protein
MTAKTKPVKNLIVDLRGWAIEEPRTRRELACGRFAKKTMFVDRSRRLASGRLSVK